MSVNMEIERKFLVNMPDIEFLDVKKYLDILQTYLENGPEGSQRRVRKITENDSESFFYTEKIFYSAVSRKETEYEISSQEYSDLLSEAKADCVPISKTRICFNYKDQLFELDIYPFSDKLAILELELDEPEQKIDFPPYINVIKEVTGIDTYSNAALGKANSFPTEYPAHNS